MNVSYGAISHATAGLVYVLISVLLARGKFRRIVDRGLLLACLLTATWLLILAAQEVWSEPSFTTRYVAEILKNAGWISVLFIVLGVHFSPYRITDTPRYLLGLAITGILAMMLISALTFGLGGVRLASGNWLVLGQVLISVAGLVLLEQVWRNESYYKRSNVRYLCLGIGALFAYDFVLYSDALLFGKVSNSIWDSRGVISTLCAPLIALTMINSSRQPIEVQISRQFVFHSSVLLLAAIYLLLIAAGGYYINKVGGAWSEAVLVLFFFVAMMALAILGSSPRIRARLLVFISQNFFDYKYDYRDEWLRVTRTITASDSTERMDDRTIRVLAELVDSPGGILWLRDEDNNFVIRANWNMPEIKHHRIDVSSELVEFLSQSDWVIDLNEYQSDPTRYHLIEIPDCVFQARNPWLIVPLVVKEQLFGFVLLGESLSSTNINWENYDLIKIVARQVGSYLALIHAQDKLSESKQFDAVNRASAFVIHDIKTIVAQLSLLVNNAEKHKGNPAFVDDMIKTTAHTVKKMNHLLTQIRNPVTRDANIQFELVQLLREIQRDLGAREPVPVITGDLAPITLVADRDKLKDALVHLIQNAQDATPKEGEVSISVKRSSGWVVLFVQDSGKGMSEDFIKSQLFKPFESTKGLTGMGIGAYQSREFIRKLGGSMEVTSQEGHGTCFTLKIPIFSHTAPGSALLRSPMAGD